MDLWSAVITILLALLLGSSRFRLGLCMCLLVLAPFIVLLFTRPRILFRGCWKVITKIGRAVGNYSRSLHTYYWKHGKRRRSLASCPVPTTLDGFASLAGVFSRGQESGPRTMEHQLIAPTTNPLLTFVRVNTEWYHCDERYWWVVKLSIGGPWLPFHLPAFYLKRDQGPSELCEHVLHHSAAFLHGSAMAQKDVRNWLVLRNIARDHFIIVSECGLRINHAHAVAYLVFDYLCP